MSTTEFRTFLETWLRLAMRSLAAGALAYVFMDWRHIGDLIAVGHIVLGEMINLCVWAKGNAGQGSFYRSKHELVGIFVIGDGLIVTTSSSAGLDEIAATSGSTQV